MKKTIVFLILLASFANVMVIFITFETDKQQPDSAFINDAVNIALQSDSVYESVNILTDKLIKAFEDMDTARHHRDDTLQIYLCIAIWVFAFIGILLCLYCEQNFFMPFYKLKNFAHCIANGNLDIPLEMDKNNLFGAFTESFDLMREQLHTARENEYKANQSKKELVASLSHDIKTPVASIMSAMDIMLLKAKDEKERKSIESVNAKLMQINTLVTNMFHATLEELQVLKVTPYEMQSAEISTLIRNADYEEKISLFSIPNCIILADSLRLQQVFDNIIHNSYKYAHTNISIISYIDGNYLIIDVNDFGSGVLEEEIPLLFNKFYRGKNIEKSDGYGLGLYLSKYFMEQMSGGICCTNRIDGFTVTIMLKLSGYL